MSVFSIKDLEQLTGIKAHTLRIWEQRYELVDPKRTSTNIRYYDDKDLKLLLNVAVLNKNGFKISKIAQMNQGEIQREVMQITESTLESSEYVHALTVSMVDLDENRFEKLMSNLILKQGFDKAMMEVIYPFFTKIGILWQTGAINPAQEHFISNLVRQKLIVAIDGLFVSLHPDQKKFLLFLPEGEMHELTLLFADYMIKSRGHKTIYLGQNLPLPDLEAVYNIHQPDYVLSVITNTPGPGNIQDYVNRLSESCDDSTLLLSGYQIVGEDLDIRENTKILTRIDELVNFISELETVKM